MKKYILGLMMFSLVFVAVPAFANESSGEDFYKSRAQEVRMKIEKTKAQIAELQAKIASLENQLKELEAASVSTTNTDIEKKEVKTYPSEQAFEHASDNASFKRELMMGHRGDDVKKLQEILREKGLLSSKADGIYGPKTREGVMNFQLQKGLNVNGKMDGTTMEKVMKIMKEKAEASGGCFPGAKYSYTTGQPCTTE